MTIKPDTVLLLIASMVGLVLISRSRPALAAQSSALMPGSPETIYWGTYNYANDASGEKYSATGADVRARR